MLACNPTLLFDVGEDCSDVEDDGEEKSTELEGGDSSMPADEATTKLEGGNRLCQCLNNDGSCEADCEVDCLSDCNDLTAKEGKCYSELACKPLLFDMGTQAE